MSTTSHPQPTSDLSYHEGVDSHSGDVRIFEVGPRDGLQNESVRVPTDAKIDMIERLVDAGVRDVEIGSFVHPKWVPQMADTARVAAGIRRVEGVRYWALVPNMKGLELALKAELSHVAVFLSSSESHNLKNLNRTIAQSLEIVGEVIAEAVSQGLTVRGYISTSFGCPYEGSVPFDRVMQIAHTLMDRGCRYISLGDTTGMGTPLQIRKGCRRAVEELGVNNVALHLHDTRGLGLVNAVQALEVGMRQFDASVGGMGGCPYAPGAAGNLGTEDLLYLLESLGYTTDIDLQRVVAISRDLQVDYGVTLSSKYFQYAGARL
ncbi:MAG: hydroxymethylglutaryl-CoA lyase [Myxococcota bacterium]